MATKKNKPIASILLFLLSVIFLTACNNLGYPNVIKFPSEGGSQMIASKSNIMFVHLLDGDEYADVDSTNTAELNWLKLVIYSPNKYEVVAKPNTTGAKRSMMISIQQLNYFGTITVKQD